MTSGIRIHNAEINAHRHSDFLELLNTLPAAVYLCDAEGVIAEYNEAAVKLWGRRPVVGKDLWCGSWRIYTPDGKPLPLEECPMALTLKRRKAVLGREIIIESPNGDRFNVLPHPHPLYDEKGNFSGAINMLVDVTYQEESRVLQQQKDNLSRMLEELRRSEQRYQRMITEVEDYAIILLSREGIIENLTGYFNRQ